tara:strand:+ start:2538 stop:3227 length:690 start_codon:yes stop_codon:yes gene_type:complete
MKYLFIQFFLINSLSISFAQNGYMSFYQDVRGRKAGDVLTVLVTETSNASRESRTNSSANAGMSLDGSVSGTFSKYLPLFGAQSSTSSNMDGNEGSQIKDKLEAKVSVTILEDKKNRLNPGTFRIEGKREVTINGEKNFIRIKGLIRERDISTDNTIYSYNIADAEIEYLKGSPLKNLVAPPRRFRKLGTAVLGLAMVGLAMQYQNGLPSDDDTSTDDTSTDDNTGASQ